MRPLALALALALASPAPAADAPAAQKPADPEKGFAPLLNGRDLTGWQTAPKKGPPELLDGQERAYGGRFRFADGVLTVDHKVKGDVVLATAAAFAGDVTLRFEFKPGPGCNNDVLFRGAKFDLKPADIKTFKEGEWNPVEIAVAGDKATVTVNGEFVKILPAKLPRSPLGLRAEFGPVEFRNLRLKTNPKPPAPTVAAAPVPAPKPRK